MTYDRDSDRLSGKIIATVMGAAFALSCLGGSAAHARSSSAILAVSVVVQNACAISTSRLDLRAYIAGARGSAGGWVRCNSGLVGYTVAISGSAASGVGRPGSASVGGIAGNFALWGQGSDGVGSPLAGLDGNSDFITVTVTY